MPRSAAIPLLLSALLVYAAPATAVGSGYRETETFEDVAARVGEYVRRFGADSVLFAVDIDNTLLAMREDLGSDQWFEWQEYLLEYEPNSPHLVADTFAGLLEIQGVLFDLGRMRPPEPELPETVRGVQDLGVVTLVLTSRGDEFRPATERELEVAGYEFAETTLRVEGLGRGTFAPYRSDDWAASGITPDEAAIFRLKTTPRPVSYTNGVMMVAGQHKGAMLLSILHKADWTPKAVVYVDDHGRHVHRVLDALARRGVDATVFHYHREDANVKRFRYGDKADVAESWRRLEESIKPAEEPERRPRVPAAASR